MKKTYDFKYINIIFVWFLLVISPVARIQAQVTNGCGSYGLTSPVDKYFIYYSNQNTSEIVDGVGQSNHSTGSYTATTTDSFEQGKCIFTYSGPIQCFIDGVKNPSSVTIGLFSTHTWNGDISVDPATAPAAGTSASASISATAMVQYSNCDNCSYGGTVLSSHNCEVGPLAGAVCGSGCHSYPGGLHVLCENNCTEIVDINVYSILAMINGHNMVCKGSTATYSVYTYPSGGSILWSTGETTDSIDLVVNASQDLTCTYTISGIKYKATFPIGVFPDLFMTAVLDSPKCAGDLNGGISTTVTGGATPYTYAWNTGATTSYLYNIGGGNYDVYVTDGNNCHISGQYFLPSPDSLKVTAHIDSVRCHGESNGKIKLTVTGGTPPYTYSWSDGSTTANLLGKPAGTYSVTITDSKGCKLTPTYTILQPDELTATVAPDGMGGVTASVSGGTPFTVPGGTPPTMGGTFSYYQYYWSMAPSGAYSPSPHWSGPITPGYHSLQVIDAHGCIFAIGFDF